MKFEELIKNHDIKLVLLKDKRRITKKGNYGFFDPDGNVMVSRKTRKKFRDVYTDIGILCQYIEDLGLYLSCLDIDVKDIELVKKILERYPSSIEESKNGFHIFYLSTEPVKIKQLTGKEKERCKIDIRGQRDETHDKEGNYVRVDKDAVIGNVLECDFNDVVEYAYSLFDIEAKPIGEYDGAVKPVELIRQNNNTKSNVEIFLAYYLFYQKDSWESAYDSAFPMGLQLAGWFDKKTMQRVAFKLMRISEYYSPKKWVIAFLSGYRTGNKRRPYFGGEGLPLEFKSVFLDRFEDLNENELNDLARYCKNVKLYEILELIKVE